MSVAPAKLPKDAINKVRLGHSFAEYDLIRDHPEITVQTPAIRTAIASGKDKCFFVGRRGTGKTATSLFVKYRHRNAIYINPQLIPPQNAPGAAEKLKDTRQPPFKSLVSGFKRVLLAQVARRWKDDGLLPADTPKEITKAVNSEFDGDFDLDLIDICEGILTFVANNDSKGWLKSLSKETSLRKAMNRIADNADYDSIVLIDRIDECWDGSGHSVAMLMALLHAVVEINTTCPSIRAYVFLRENMFDRVRAVDNEFSRLETWLVSLEWSRPHLLELVERRLMLPFNTKLRLGGETWERFFDPYGDRPSHEHIFDFCQQRPRDVLTFCELALESAQGLNHPTVTSDDIESARKRFADNRLKDMCDEYAENYPHIDIVISRFFGLGKEFTISGLRHAVERLLVDDSVKEFCSNWFLQHCSPELFGSLLYRLGFLGIHTEKRLQFRGQGAAYAGVPQLTSETRLVVHPTYAEALNLQPALIDELPEDWELRSGGIVTGVPGSLSHTEYQVKLKELSQDLESLPATPAHSAEFEELIGRVLTLCFFRWLTNPEAKSRSADGRVIRDWIVANTASSGFWDAMRQRYDAMQVFWECKNYADLKAEDFHQADYYMSPAGGRLVVIAYRGVRSKKKSYSEHIRRIAHGKNGGMVLLVNDQDISTFIRQALAGKTKDSHIRSIYDDTLRAISKPWRRVPGVIERVAGVAGLLAGAPSESPARCPFLCVHSTTAGGFG